MFAVQLEIDAIAAAQAVAHFPHTARHDADLVMKELLTAAFGVPAVRPWTIYRQEGRIATVLG